MEENDIVIIRKCSIRNDVGGTELINNIGDIKVRITKKWYDYETGYNFWGEVLDADKINQMKNMGITGYTPDDYKQNEKLYQEAIEARRNYNPAKVCFSEFDIVSKQKNARELNIFLYIRDSKGNMDFLKKQENELKDFIDKEFNGANVSVYQDTGTVLSEREGLNNLLNDVKENDVDWVILSHIDRLYKITYEKGLEKLNEIVEKILENGTGIISVRENKCLKSYKRLKEEIQIEDEDEEEM